CLSDEDALTLLRDYNQRCDPPWSEAELLHKVDDARRRGQMPFGYLLGEVSDLTDPDFLAQTFLAGQVWRTWNGQFWRYDGTRYGEVPKEEVQAALNQHTQRVFDAVFGREERDRARLEEAAKGTGPEAREAKDNLQKLKPLKRRPGVTRN